MIFVFVSRWLNRTKGVSLPPNASATFKEVKQYVVPRWIAKPIALCISCMASFHGGFIYFVLAVSGIVHLGLIHLIIGIVSASFIQTYIWESHEYIDVRIKYFKKKSEL